MAREKKVSLFDHEAFKAWLDDNGEVIEELEGDLDGDWSNADTQTVIKVWRAYSGQVAGRVSKDSIDWTRDELAVLLGEVNEDEGVDEAEEDDSEGEGTEIDDGAEDEEDGGKGSVVNHKYKKIYREAGHADNCGDWLAKLLEENTRGGEAGFILSLYTEILDANGIEWQKYTVNQSRGWLGRLRMTTRAMLARAISDAGHIILNGKKVKVPADFAARFKTKPKKVKVKTEKVAKAA